MGIVSYPPKTNDIQKPTSSPKTYKNNSSSNGNLSQDPLAQTRVTFMQMQDVPEPAPVVSTRYPVLFAGCQNGELVVYSLRLPNYDEGDNGKADARDIELLYPSARIRLTDSITNISVCWTCNNTRPLVFVALANGHVLMFQKTLGVPHESPSEEPVWDLTQYYLIKLGMDQSNPVGALISLDRYVWASMKNTVYVIDTMAHGIDSDHAKSAEDLIPPRIVTCFQAHPRKESRIKSFCEDKATSGRNVWVSVRLDSTVRLFSSKAPEFQHLYDIDVEPFVTKMIGSDRLGFSFVRVTAIHASQNRLWIGSGNGIIISVPLVNQNQNSVKELPSYDSVHSDTLGDQEEEVIITPAIENAQLALHGFKDAVRFFCESDGLVIAGGVGSIDFRSEMIGQNVPAGNSNEKSHLLAWQEK